MNNPWDELKQALSEAENINRACDHSANSMAHILRGRLRHVNDWNLKALKRELRDFNIHTGKWK